MQRIDVWRMSLVYDFKREGYKYGYLTCDFCGDRHTCEFAYDGYNTDGDCLAMK